MLRTTALLDGAAEPETATFFGRINSLTNPTPKDPNDMKGLAKTADKLLDNFPSIFTLFTVSIYIMPIWMLAHVGEDQNVKYWISKKIWMIALILPLVYFITHIRHVMTRIPNRPVVITSLYGSAVAMIFLSQYVMVGVYHHGNAALASDCNASPAKAQLQVEHEAAVQFYVDCVVRLQSVHNLTFSQSLAYTRIRDCEGYKAEAAKHGDNWAYLAHMEDSYHCSGWCKAKPAIWTYEATTDTCPDVVADILFHKVKWCMEQVVIYNIVVLSFVATVSIRVGPVLRNVGIEW